jgi:uncharacterized OB-fold protein
VEPTGDMRQSRPTQVAREASKMFTRNKRSTRAHCEHRDVITVRNAGIERTICEQCGRVSFTAHEIVSAGVERSRFERNVERQQQPVG